MPKQIGLNKLIYLFITFRLLVFLNQTQWNTSALLQQFEQ